MHNVFESLKVLIDAERGTIKAAAKYVGVHRSTLNRWREYQAEPRAEHVLALREFIPIHAVTIRARREAEAAPKPVIPPESRPVLVEPLPPRMLTVREMLNLFPEPLSRPLPASVPSSWRYGSAW